MSLQTLFDHIVDSLVAQGEPSIVVEARHVVYSDGLAIEPATRCVYRGTSASGNPLKCAAGHVIPDDLYEPEFDGVPGKLFSHLPESTRERIASDAGVPPRLLDWFVGSMQGAHDGPVIIRDLTGPEWLSCFLRNAGVVGDKYGLDTTRVEAHILTRG
jgi:hypothetical protein